MNEQLLLEHIRQRGPCSRAELARVSGLSKPTVSLALDNVERAGLVRIAGQRTGVPGRSARLYEIRPDAGLVLGLDIGHEYVRGAIADLTGEIRTRASLRAHATSVRARVAELVELAGLLCEDAGVTRSAVTQTVIGSPGVYDPRRNAMKLTGGLRGWDRPAALAGLREAFGPSLVMENDVDAAALAERALGHGREVDNFAFVHIGTGIGMGLILGGQLLRGAHGVAGEIAFMPLSGGAGADEHEARKRGTLEAAASASGIVRAARRGGMRGSGVRAPRVRGRGGRRRAGAGGRGRRGAAGGQDDLRGHHRGRPGPDRARRRDRAGPGLRRVGDHRTRADRAGHARDQGQRPGHRRRHRRLPGRRHRTGLGSGHDRAAHGSGG